MWLSTTKTSSPSAVRYMLLPPWPRVLGTGWKLRGGACVCRTATIHGHMASRHTAYAVWLKAAVALLDGPPHWLGRLVSGGSPLRAAAVHFWRHSGRVVAVAAALDRGATARCARGDVR